MNLSVSQNTEPTKTNIMIRERPQRYHRPNSRSCGDGYDATNHLLGSTPTYASRRSASSDAASAQPIKLHSYHGRKPSLVGFDPFSFSDAAEQQPLKAKSMHSKQLSVDASLIQSGILDLAAAYNTPAATNHASPRTSPPAPPANHHFATHQTTSSPVGIAASPSAVPTLSQTNSNDESFDNENNNNNNNNENNNNTGPMKKVNKFLRKSVLVKNFSIGGSRRTKQQDQASCTPKKTPKSERDGVSPTNSPPTMPLTMSLSNGEETAHSQETPSGMSQDLLELKEGFENLQLPSLSLKASPTSFLTGSDHEAINATFEPSPFQLEIPSLKDVLTMSRLVEFVENYRHQDQHLDLKQFLGMSRAELRESLDRRSVVKEHVPILESLLECAEEISIQGFLAEPGNKASDDRTEAVVFQGQRNFTVIFRGTNEQQSRGGLTTKAKRKAATLDGSPSSHPIEVYSGLHEAYSRVEDQCFRLVDKLVDENPFCDVFFAGYSFGGAMATLAAYRYAKARPMMRVGCQTLASPKVGFSHFKQAVHALPNLQVLRLELLQDTICQGPTVGGYHVGHTLVLNTHTLDQTPPPPSSSSSQTRQSFVERPSVSVYKFDVAPKQGTKGVVFFKIHHIGLKKYISILEDLATLKNGSWAKDFCNTSGNGVVVNNEPRLMV